MVDFNQDLYNQYHVPTAYDDFLTNPYFGGGVSDLTPTITNSVFAQLRKAWKNGTITYDDYIISCDDLNAQGKLSIADLNTYIIDHRYATVSQGKPYESPGDIATTVLNPMASLTADQLAQLPGLMASNPGTSSAQIANDILGGVDTTTGGNLSSATSPNISDVMGLYGEEYTWPGYQQFWKGQGIPQNVYTPMGNYLNSLYNPLLQAWQAQGAPNFNPTTGDVGRTWEDFLTGAVSPNSKTGLSNLQYQYDTNPLTRLKALPEENVVRAHYMAGTPGTSGTNDNQLWDLAMTGMRARNLPPAVRRWLETQENEYANRYQASATTTPWLDFLVSQGLR